MLALARVNNIRYGYLALLFIVFSLDSCSQKYNLDSLEKQKLSYDELPKKVASKFKQVISNRFPGEDIEGDDFFNLERTKITFNWVTIDNDPARTMKNGGTFYEFKTKNKVLKLNGNLGDPFIIYKSALYYPNEFNTGRDDYKNVKYIKIDFKPLLEK